MQELLLLYFKEPDVSINTQRYTQILDTLHKAIKNKYPGMLSSGVIILHDNAGQHVTKVRVEALARKRGSPGTFSLQSRSVALRLSHLWTAEEKPNVSPISLRRERKRLQF
ncbi:hypothetical protein TNIN_14931 [Trichonephila inaurata madagascariensis]|uniref:Transposase n=1 Tax=Trichonephila inaurata madagascariensis TaxID=2747483 RepID=A0A8X7C888_9ARAC|nr:hypothetical protein TNIN_14931 [Trichonephila inaurata madagascariensis]